MTWMKTYLLVVWAAILVHFGTGDPVMQMSKSGMQARNEDMEMLDSRFSRPPYKEYVKVARWLVARADWGVLSTNGASSNKDVGGYVFGNVMSYTDGKKAMLGMGGTATGVPIFYMTTLDGSARDLQVSPKASFTMSEASLPGGCLLTAAEEPTCAKITLVGSVNRVPDDEVEEAKQALFSRHPFMRFWPEEHGFQPYKMDIEKVFFLDFYGGAPSINVTEYLSASLNNDQFDDLESA